MSNCIPGNDGKTCSQCGWVYHGRRKFPNRNCTKVQGENPPQKSPREHVNGVGDNLHNLIHRYFRIDITPTCSCTDRIKKLNAWGPTECRKRIDEIVGWLITESNTRFPKLKWLTETKVSRFVIKCLIIRAIRLTEREV